MNKKLNRMSELNAEALKLGSIPCAICKKLVGYHECYELYVGGDDFISICEVCQKLPFITVVENKPKSSALLLAEDLQQLTDWFIELNRRLIRNGVLDSYIHLERRFEELEDEREEEYKELVEKAEKLETIREFVLSRRDDIEKDMENFGVLKPVLNYFLEEAEVPKIEAVENRPDLSAMRREEERRRESMREH